MAPRPYWKGHLRISLVIAPVKLYSAGESSGGVHLNQLHEECHSRIKYVKTCPVHGEVTKDEIVSGYKVGSRYVVVEPNELDKLRTESDHAITVGGFIKSDELDPLYYAGKSYYILPDGPVGKKAYTLIHRAMEEEDLHGIAQFVLAGREQLMLLRTVGKLLTLTDLHYAAEVREPSIFEKDVDAADYKPNELALTRQLVTGLVEKKFDLADYPDQYAEKLRALVKAKAKGEELVAPPDEEGAPIINLMEALKASLGEAAEKPARKMAGSRKKRATKKARRKRA
jgi:DNA end-binding protein Ku